MPRVRESLMAVSGYYWSAMLGLSSARRQSIEKREGIDAGKRSLGAVIHPGLLAALVALILRLAALIVFHAYHIPSGQDHFAFGGEMGRIARSIVFGQGFSSPFGGRTGPTAMVGPIYPYVLAGVFKTFGIYTGASAWVMLGLNSVFSALTCLSLAALGERCFSRRVGSFAAWIWVFFPYAVYWPLRWIWDTSLSALLFATLLLLAVHVENSRRIRDWIGFGLFGALTVLTNTTILAVFVLLVGWLSYRWHRRGRRWTHLAAATLLASALGLTPWVVRNYVVFGHFVLRSNLGLELYQGNYHQHAGLRDPRLDPFNNATEMRAYQELGELGYMAQKQRQALQFVTRSPQTFAWLSVRRVVYFWTGTSEIVVPGRLLESLGFYTLVSALAFTGLFLTFTRRTGWGLLYAIVLIVFPLPYYFTHPEARFRHLIEPEMVVLIAYTVAGAHPILGRPRK